jgi:hypothetical protein
LGEIHAHLGYLLLVLQDQLHQDLPLLAKTSGLIDALDLLEVSGHQPPEEILRVKRSLLV